MALKEGFLEERSVDVGNVGGEVEVCETHWWGGDREDEGSGKGLR